MISPLLEKKYIYIYNEKKKICCAEIWKGYCPNRILRGGLYCNTKFVLQPRWLEGGWFKEGLYCKMGVVGLETVLQYNLLYCKKRLGCREFVSQYKKLYCECSGKRQGCLCRKTGCCVARRRWAQAEQALGAQQGARGAHRRACVGRAGGRCMQLGARARGAAGARERGALGAGACGASRRAGHGRLGSTGTQPVRTGWASWVLVHPAWFSTWFFDSVFFLRH